MDVALEKASPQKGRGCRRCNARGQTDARQSLRQKDRVGRQDSNPYAQAEGRRTAGGPFSHAARISRDVTDDNDHAFSGPCRTCGVAFLFAAKEKGKAVRRIA